NRELFTSHPVTVRVPFINPSRAMYTATFENGGQKATPQIATHRFYPWLEATFNHLKLNDDGTTATVALLLNGSPETSIGMDKLRCYNRTQYVFNGNPLPIPFEASFEIYVEK
ncbi:MAG: hypothetical protein IKS92_04355, partial [Victivallales bacterium]|nr:hypothetical protein [Victivallales bacterium]